MDSAGGFTGASRWKADAPDPLEKLPGDVYKLLENKYYDDLYVKAVSAFNAWCAKACNFFDVWIWNSAVQIVSYVVLGFSWLNHFIDSDVVNRGFDKSCDGVTLGGRIMSRLQSGRVQNYLRIVGVALTVLALLLMWGCKGQ